MDISYDASGKTASGGDIYGSVVINSQSAVSNSAVEYSIISCQFSCNGLTCKSTPVPDQEVIRVPLGPLPDSVVPGNGFWQLCGWVTDTGALFKHVDGSAYQDKLSEYQCLPPIIDLCCDNADINNTGPFIPYGRLILTWSSKKPGMPTGLHINK